MNKELIKTNSEYSSIRYVMLQILDLIKGSVIVLLLIFVYQAYKGVEVDWVGGAAFIGALGVLLTGISGTKAYQKRGEQG